MFFTTGVMVGLAGASTPLIFLISMVGMCATASSLAQFAGVYPSAGSFITYITRAIGTKVAVAIGIITILGYMIAFGGIYIFVGDLRPGQPSPYNTLPWLTLALVAVGVIYPFVLNARRPDVLDLAPALLEGEESTAVDPLPIGE